MRQATIGPRSRLSVIDSGCAGAGELPLRFLPIPRIVFSPDAFIFKNEARASSPHCRE